VGATQKKYSSMDFLGRKNEVSINLSTHKKKSEKLKLKKILSEENINIDACELLSFELLSFGEIVQK
jgi:hypothetical protein